MAGRYPWGEKLTPDHANYDKTGIGTTTAVGIFPQGRKPCWRAGHERQRLGVVPDKVARRLQGQAGRYAGGRHATRVLRGGAFSNNARNVRCAYRSGTIPDYRYGDYGFRVVASPIIHDSGG